MLWKEYKENDSIDIKRFRKFVNLKQGEQHDAHECLIEIVDRLKESSK